MFSSLAQIIFPPPMTPFPSVCKHVVISSILLKTFMTLLVLYHQLHPFSLLPLQQTPWKSCHISVLVSLLPLSLMPCKTRLSCLLFHQSCSQAHNQCLSRREIQWLVLSPHYTAPARSGWPPLPSQNTVFIQLLGNQELPQLFVFPLLPWAPSQYRLLTSPLLFNLPMWKYHSSWSSLLFSVYSHILVDIMLTTSKCKLLFSNTHCLHSLQVNPTASATRSPPCGSLRDNLHLIPQTEHLIFLPRLLPMTAFLISVDWQLYLFRCLDQSIWSIFDSFVSPPPYYFQSIRQYGWLYLQN